MSTSSFPLVDVQGTPYECGHQHGAAVPERVAASVALYRTQLERRGVAAEDLDLLAQAFLPVIKAYDTRYLEEMRGIADGAGVRLAEVVLINCRTEMMFGHAELLRRARGEADDDLNDGCTGIVVLPEATRDGRLLHAHNWDWREECVDTGVVLRVRRDDGPDFLAFAEADALARHGFNANGVSLSGNFLTSDRDYRRQGTAPLGLLRRKMLEAENMAQAMRVLWSGTRFCSNNLMLAQAEGEAVDLETCPDEIFWVTPQRGLLVHANHWMSPAAQAKLVDLGLVTSPDSLYRQRRVQSALDAAHGIITLDTLKTVLADSFGHPDAVLRSPKPAAFDSISATVATTLMDPAARRMWIARKPYATHEFVEYQL